MHFVIELGRGEQPRNELFQLWFNTGFQSLQIVKCTINYSDQLNTRLVQYTNCLFVSLSEIVLCLNAIQIPDKFVQFSNGLLIIYHSISGQVFKNKTSLDHFILEIVFFFT
jgi:hypothetical protein